MAYDQGLAQRVREALDEQATLTEKKMFGGIGFMLQGNMACGVLGNELIVRVGPEQYDDAVTRPHVRAFDFTGRAMRGWVMVSAEGHEADRELCMWIELGSAFAASLPSK